MLWSARLVVCLLAVTLSPALRAQAITVVSSASFDGARGVAPNSIASAFGADLSTASEAADSVPLPTQLAGVSLVLTDSAGAPHTCPLFFVSPGQINFLVPGEAALGTATIAVQPIAAPAQSLTGMVSIENPSPGLFFDGDNYAAAQVLRVKADGTQVFDITLARDAAGKIVPKPIEMSPGGDESDQIFLLVFGTGLRGNGGLENVTSLVGTALIPQIHTVETLFLGDQGAFAGLDQGNLGPLPRSLENLGGGLRNVRVDIGEQQSNVVRIMVARNPNAPVLSNLAVRQDTIGGTVVLFIDVDFADADADLGRPSVVIQLEDDQRFCSISGAITDGSLANQTAGSSNLAIPQAGPAVFLGEITSVTVSMGDDARHISNVAEFVPAPGMLGNAPFACLPFSKPGAGVAQLHAEAGDELD